MTQIIEDNQVCSVCGTDVKCVVLMSTNTQSSPDLDLRPAEMQRSTMHVWLQECSQCGYVNGDLSDAIENAKEIVESKAYQALLVESEIPKLARRFVRYALLNTQDKRALGTAYLHAAWVCDDAEKSEQAIEFRNQAADSILTVEPFADNEEDVTVATSLVDVLRRANRFEESKRVAASLKETKSVAANEVIAAVLSRQIQLCDRRDTGVYVIADVMESG